MRSHTILLVDDDPNVLAGLRRALKHEPYTVCIALDADAALGILRAKPVDVVISDEAMPGLSGIEFLARVQVEYPATIRMMLTGHVTAEVAIRAINEGEVYRFFTKPCNPIDLAITIRQGLQQKDLLAESRRLLEMVRRQSAAIEELDSEVTGLTYVARDRSGAVVVSDAPADLDALLREVQAELDAADRRLVARQPPTCVTGSGAPRTETK